MISVASSALERLDNMDRPALANEWERVLKSRPPKAASRPLLLAALGYEAQVKKRGGLLQAEKKALAKSLQGVAIKPSNSPLPGSVLVRDWHGITYRVEVVDKGYLFKGENWSSLSAIAKHITGARWSGPRFFGVSS